MVIGLACMCIITGMRWQRRRVSIPVSVKGEQMTVFPDHKRSLIFSL